MRGRCYFVILIFPFLTQGTSAQHTQPYKGPISNKREGSAIREKIYTMKYLLKNLGYWVTVLDSTQDQEFRFALNAFRRIEKLPKGRSITDQDIEVARISLRPSLKERSYKHIEVDLTKQVLIYTDSSSIVFHVIPISTGSGELFTSEGRTRHAITPPGRFKVYYKVSGWRISPLGGLYFPLYVKSGVAIHGSFSVPDYPASHGCIRIPMVYAKPLFDIVPIGTPVLVYSN